MNLQRKLEEIRRKPEHIKLRYTYFAVAISMILIILLWVFSVSDSVKKTNLVKKQNVFDDLQTQKKSLKDATTDVKKSLDDLSSNLQSTTPSATKTLPSENQPQPEDTPSTPTLNPPPSTNSEMFPKSRPLPNTLPSNHQ